MSKVFKCPDCGAVRDSVNYTAKTYGSEWGRYINGDWEYDDSETSETDSYTYECRDCNHEFSQDEVDENTFEEDEVPEDEESASDEEAEEVRLRNM